RGGDVLLRAGVRSGDVGIRAVRFYAGDRRVGKVRAAPYRAVWHLPRVRGKVAVTVEVTDETGATVRSDPVTLRAGQPDRDRQGQR
ncbi:MAG: hypothetical protein ACRDPT_17100, partial [Streptomycetales bacterium]